MSTRTERMPLLSSIFLSFWYQDGQQKNVDQWQLAVGVIRLSKRLTEIHGKFLESNFCHSASLQVAWKTHSTVGGGFKHSLYSPIPAEMIQFDLHEYFSFMGGKKTPTTNRITYCGTVVLLVENPNGTDMEGALCTNTPRATGQNEGWGMKDFEADVLMQQMVQPRSKWCWFWQFCFSLVVF